MVARRLLSSTMRSNDDNDWHVNSLMLSLHDLSGLPMRRLPSTVPRSMIFGSVSWRQAWPNHDNLRRLMIKFPAVRRRHYTLLLWSFHIAARSQKFAEISAKIYMLTEIKSPSACLCWWISTQLQACRMQTERQYLPIQWSRLPSTLWQRPLLLVSMNRSVIANQS